MDDNTRFAVRIAVVIETGCILVLLFIHSKKPSRASEFITVPGTRRKEGGALICC